MTESTHELIGADRRRRLLLTATTAAVFAFLVSYVFAILNINGVLRTGLVSDIHSYNDIAEALLDGLVPYFDFMFEHLPVSAAPIAVIGFLARSTGVSMWVMWPLVMTPLFVVTALWVDRLDPDNPSGFRFVAVSIPMLPLILFRLEPWIVFLAVAGLLAFVLGHAALGVTLTVLATLGKGWPIAIALFPWKRGMRRAAVLTVVVSIALLAIVASLDGFRSGRAFDGIHTETIAGSIVLLFRHLTGAALGTGSAAGARYIDVPTVTVLINAIPGLILVGVGVAAALRSPIRWTQSAVGITVLGIILLSPLSSTQFIYWVAPFVAMLELRQRSAYITAGIFALASIAVYEPDSVLWNLEVIARNAALIVLAVMWASTLVKQMPRPGSAPIR